MGNPHASPRAEYSSPINPVSLNASSGLRLGLGLGLLVKGAHNAVHHIVKAKVADIRDILVNYLHAAHAVGESVQTSQSESREIHHVVMVHFTYRYPSQRAPFILIEEAFFVLGWGYSRQHESDRDCMAVRPSGVRKESGESEVV